MAKDAIERFNHRFQAYIYPSIRLCLQNYEGVAASILLCCAIDLLAKYRSGDTEKRFNKRKYISFLDDYFPGSYDPASFYKFVRSGLLHSFSMEREYTILCNDADWAKEAHLQVDPKSQTIVINPHVLLRDVHATFKKYISSIRSDAEVKKAFYVVHRAIPLKKQQISWRKMKHMKSSND